MNPLYNDKEYEDTKPSGKLPFKCKQCNKIFYKSKGYINSVLTHKITATIDFCSSKCSHNFESKSTIQTVCDNCKTSINRVASQYNKRKNHFCSCKCRSLYHYTNCICNNCGVQIVKINNKYKRFKNHFCSRTCYNDYNLKNLYKPTGIKRSKLEKWLEIQLTKLYPNIDFIFNKRDTINSELDIYIPSLKLAFELNGPMHYEPIFGTDKLKYTQNNDQRKFQACLEKKIELCIIDTSSQKYFKENTSQNFLDMIINIIKLKSH